MPADSAKVKSTNGTIRFLQILMVGSIALPIILFAFASWLNYQTTLQAADERIERSLTILHEQASYIFRSTELLLATTNRTIGALSDAEISASQERYHLMLAEIAAGLPQTHSIWIFGADGRPIASSNVFPVPSTFTNTDRDYFNAQIAQDMGTYIGAVVAPKVAGVPIFSISRRRAGQEFRGVVAAAIQPMSIQAFYEAIGHSRGSYYGMLRDDGAFLTRYPAPVALALKLDENSATRKAIAENPSEGFVSTKSQTDGVSRRIGYRKLAGFPIYLLAGTDREAIIAEWTAQMASHLIFGVPATAIMFAAIFYGMARTKRLHAEAAAREAAETTLRQTQKIDSIGQLTGGVAHDFNNLLTIIVGNLEVAKTSLERSSEALSARALRAVENASHGAQRAVTLTRRLLAFSRQQPLTPTVIDTTAVFRESADLFRKALGENRELEIVGGAGAWNIEVDRGQLEVAVLNLIINAKDAIANHGKVTLETGNTHFDDEYRKRHPELKTGQYVMVSITDTGEGMSQETLTKVFEPFFTTKPVGKGTGLGLSQVYGFVKQSGGHITIYSEPGQGTTVKMYFPRVHLAATASEQETEDRTIPLGRGECILLVEDDAEVRRYVAESLIDFNYKTHEASNGGQALKLLAQRAKHFDLLLTDVVMPGMNGRELADKARAIIPEMKVVYMTGYSRNAIIHHGRLDPGVNLLQKPFSREELATCIAAALQT